jgi:hypothetical protein
MRVNKELHLLYKLYKLFRTLSRDETFFNLLNIFFLSVTCFTNGMTTRSSQPSQLRVCGCMSQTRLFTYSGYCGVLYCNKFICHKSFILWETNFPRSSRHCIHSRCCPRFLARCCVLRLYWSVSYVTWRTFHIDTRSHIIQSFQFHKENIMSDFAICHPVQRRVPLLVTDKFKPPKLLRVLELCYDVMNENEYCLSS